jgi:hypothetical protein
VAGKGKRPQKPSGGLGSADALPQASRRIISLSTDRAAHVMSILMPLAAERRTFEISRFVPRRLIRSLTPEPSLGANENYFESLFDDYLVADASERIARSIIVQRRG